MFKVGDRVITSNTVPEFNKKLGIINKIEYYRIYVNIPEYRGENYLFLESELELEYITVFNNKLNSLLANSDKENKG